MPAHHAHTKGPHSQSRPQPQPHSSTTTNPTPHNPKQNQPQPPNLTPEESTELAALISRVPLIALRTLTTIAVGHNESEPARKAAVDLIKLLPDIRAATTTTTTTAATPSQPTQSQTTHHQPNQQADININTNTDEPTIEQILATTNPTYHDITTLHTRLRSALDKLNAALPHPSPTPTAPQHSTSQYEQTSPTTTDENPLPPPTTDHDEHQEPNNTNHPADHQPPDDIHQLHYHQQQTQSQTTKPKQPHQTPETPPT